jgi:hypothetical protein
LFKKLEICEGERPSSKSFSILLSLTAKVNTLICI